VDSTPSATVGGNTHVFPREGRQPYSHRVSIFDERISKQQVRDDANPGGTVHIDGNHESLSHGIQQALLQTVSVAKAATMTPTDRMKVEHARLFKAFRDAEGRDPDANGDPEFWAAHASITKARGGRPTDPDSQHMTKVQKGGGEDVSEQLRKRLAEGPGADEPAWVQAVIDGERGR
jgi:hypothetical protein